MDLTLLANKLHPMRRIRIEQLLDRTIGYRLRTLRNSPRVTSGFLHQQALQLVGSDPLGTGAVIFDVGAHLGETSLALSLELPGVVIHAFEPIQSIFEQLLKNCQGYPNVVCHKLALGSSQEQRWIELRKGDPLSTMNQVTARASQSTPAELRQSISISTVDLMCEELKTAKLALLKIDVEGYELEVLRGADAMLRAHKIASIMAEVTLSSDSKQHVNIDQVRAILEPCGYRLTGFYDSAYRQETGDLYYTNALFRLCRSNHV